MSETRVVREVTSEALTLIGEAARYALQGIGAIARGAWRSRVDIAIAGLIGAACAVFAVWRFAAFDFAVLSTAMDLWFSSDVPRVIEANADRWSIMHYRSAVHPLFPLLASLPMNILAQLGFSSETISVIFVALGAFVFAATFYAAARAMKLQRIDATLATALMLTTSGAMFWLTVPESYALGAATILIAFIWLAAPRTAHDAVLGPLQSAVTLSITVTNWMAGLVAAVLALGLRRAISVSLIGFAIVLALSAPQQWLFEHAGKPFSFAEEVTYMSGEATRIGDRIATLIGQPVLAGEPIATIFSNGRMVIDFGDLQSFFTQTSPLFWLALLGWLGLIALGVEALLKRTLPPRIALFLVIVIAGQLALHLFYGDGYFLYALHFTPLLALIVAAPALGRRRMSIRALMLVTVLASGAHNFAQLGRATQLLNTYPTRVLESQAASSERAALRLAMLQRPEDPWPRAQGHVVWAVAGSPLAEKSYLEPGGSFSPRPGAPGFSLWAFDGRDELLSTSDTVENAHQRFETIPGDLAPAVIFETPYYTARWRRIAPDRWRLDATPASSAQTLALSVRAVGPAAGPITAIEAQGADAVLIDGCWRARVPLGGIAYLGEDGAAGWHNAAHTPPRHHESASGWAAARLAPSGGGLVAEIDNTCGPSAPSRWPIDSGARVTPASLPLAQMLSEQSAHLLMGLDGAETRAGDPVTYVQAWMRDGAYTIVALVRAGRLDVARDLVTPFAEHDFFGGFGAEADAPGLSIWALSEVARADPSLDTTFWPHVKRKADLILTLLAAREDVRMPYAGTITEEHPDLDLVARAAEHGLIAGRMDWGTPLLYVNAFAWRGLTDAAAFADRVGAVEDAARWREAADRLHAAWRLRLRSEGLLNPRTTASLVWPTRAGALDAPIVRALLEDLPRGYAQRPEWTYFEVARAHQHMALGDPDTAWSQLDALMAHSPMPDLGMLWEGVGGGEGNWRAYRAWVQAPPITPHYWSAAELMLFALESLAMVDETRAPILVIGAGLRQQDLTQQIEVRNVRTPAGAVSWRWDGRSLLVETEFDAARARGPSLPGEHTDNPRRALVAVVGPPRGRGKTRAGKPGDSRALKGGRPWGKAQRPLSVRKAGASL